MSLIGWFIALLNQSDQSDRLDQTDQTNTKKKVPMSQYMYWNFFWDNIEALMMKKSSKGGMENVKRILADNFVNSHEA